MDLKIGAWRLRGLLIGYRGHGGQEALRLAVAVKRRREQTLGHDPRKRKLLCRTRWETVRVGSAIE